MEQAYRQRKGLPLLTDADIEALKPASPWRGKSGGAGVSHAAAPVAAPVARPSASSPPVSNRRSRKRRLSEDVAKWVAEGKNGASPPSPRNRHAADARVLPALNDARSPPCSDEPVESCRNSAAAAPVAAVAPPQAAIPAGPISADVAKWVAEGKKWSKSTIAAEQARRRRKGFPTLNDAEIAALLGEPAAPPQLRLRAVATSAAGRSPLLAAVRLPGRAFVSGGPFRAAVSRQLMLAHPRSELPGPRQPEASPPSALKTTKSISSAGAWPGAAFAAFLVAWFLAFFRFFLPRTLFEPATSFKIGYPADFGLGVDTKFQQKYRIWVDRTPDRIFVIYARCTHLGCTPDWKPAENKFKCPCHGSGYDSEGINFEGPAPRPMDRANVEIAPDGQILVDVSKLYQWPKGQPTQFNEVEHICEPSRWWRGRPRPRGFARRERR